MVKLPQRVAEYPRLTKVTTVDKAAEAIAFVQSILPPVLKEFPVSVLLPVECIAEHDMKHFFEKCWPIMVSGKRFNEEFLPVHVISGIIEQSFLHDFMSLIYELIVSVSFKINPVEVDYGRVMDGLGRRVVYDTLKFELKHYRSAPQNGFGFHLVPASYPKNWVVCEKCCKAFDFTTLEGNSYFSWITSDDFWKDQEKRKEFYLEQLKQGNNCVSMLCPHCKKGTSFHEEENYIPTLEEYKKFYPY